MSRYPKQKPRTPLPRRLYGIDEYVEVSGKCRAQIYNEMNAGKLPFVIDGGRRKIPVDFIDRQITEAMKRFETSDADSAPAPEAAHG